MLGILMMFMFYMIPLAVIVFFITSLCWYKDSKKKYKTEPSENNEQNYKKHKTLLIVSAIILGVMLAVVIGFMALMYMAIAYM